MSSGLLLATGAEAAAEHVVQPLAGQQAGGTWEQQQRLVTQVSAALLSCTHRQLQQWLVTGAARNSKRQPAACRPRCWRAEMALGAACHTFAASLCCAQQAAVAVVGCSVQSYACCMIWAGLYTSLLVTQSSRLVAVAAMQA